MFHSNNNNMIKKASFRTFEQSSRSKTSYLSYPFRNRIKQLVLCTYAALQFRNNSPYTTLPKLPFIFRNSPYMSLAKEARAWPSMRPQGLAAGLRGKCRPRRCSRSHKAAQASERILDACPGPPVPAPALGVTRRLPDAQKQQQYTVLPRLVHPPRLVRPTG